MNKFRCHAAAALAFMSFCLPVCASPADDLAKGEIIENVQCLRDSDQSYALYLPADYSVDQKWPIVYAFDPVARGAEPLKHFKQAAEKFRFIVAGSNNARNGPWEPIYRAAQALWEDTHERLSLDEQRIYSTGFSGGARAASLFFRMIDRPVAGIIACGAGLAVGLESGGIAPSVFYGMVGTEDFNYREMMTLDKSLDENNVRHWIQAFEGGHEWPPADQCAEAWEWMETLAAGRTHGSSGSDQAKREALYAEAMERAAALEESGRIVQAVSQYEKIHSLFEGTRETSDLSRIISRLKQSLRYRDFKKKDAARNKKETAKIKEFAAAFTAVDRSEAPGGKVGHTPVNVEDLFKTADKAADPYDRALAVRLLLSLSISASTRGQALHGEKKYARAAVYFEIAARSSERDSGRFKYNLYNLACAQAMSGNAGQAVESLRRAVANGLTGREFIMNDQDLDGLKDMKGFQEIVDHLK